MSDLYRLIYASRNLLVEAEAKTTPTIQQILEASQRNNTKVGVTGALMFNGAVFAQVLEGPRQGVEYIFGRVQNDNRHGDVAVLRCDAVKDRGFVNWSMKLVGQSAHGQAYFNNLVEKSEFDPSRLNTTSFLRCCMVLCWMENVDREGMLYAEHECVANASMPAFKSRDVFGLTLPVRSGDGV